VTPTARRFAFTRIALFIATTLTLLRIALICNAELAKAGTYAPTATPARLEVLGLKAVQGQLRPSFRLDQLQGDKEALGQFREKIVLVHFFATWCAPCRDELALLQTMADQLQDYPVAVVAIDVANLDLRAKGYFKSSAVSFPVLIDRDRRTAFAWNVYSLPATFILDQSLQPKYIAEDSIDWSRSDIIEFIRNLASHRESA
jgi:thiol-disulfide isomerase/thioredoxin